MPLFQGHCCKIATCNAASRSERKLNFRRRNTPAHDTNRSKVQARRIPYSDRLTAPLVLEGVFRVLHGPGINSPIAHDLFWIASETTSLAAQSPQINRQSERRPRRHHGLSENYRPKSQHRCQAHDRAGVVQREIERTVRPEFYFANASVAFEDDFLARDPFTIDHEPKQRLM